jgi:hypothetical protein
MGLPIMKTWLIMAALAAGLAGCSGGGSSSCGGGTVPIGGGSASSASCGNTTPPTTTPKITAAISSTTVTSAAPATVTATLLDASGNPVANTVVTFTVNAAIGSLSAPSALTNSSGVATVTLSPAGGASANSADTVIATATVDGTAVTSSVGYQLSTASAAFTGFTADPLDSQGKLPAYGQTSLTLTMSGVSTSAPVSVSITSDCVSAGKATISPAQTTNTTGTMTFVYQDTGGCGATLANDNITATASGALVPTDVLQLGLQTPAPTSLAFVDSGTTQIFLKGSGFAESASVKFKVVDIAGNPLPGQHVTMGLTTYTGGLQIDGSQAAVTKTTNSLGEVSVIVNAGTVPTPVRVQAFLGDTLSGTINTVSSSLAVGTGLPTELGFSLSQDTINIEGYQYDNAWNGYTVSASDRSGNPIHDNTAITFWSESGQIPASTATTTTNGLSFATVSYGTQHSSMPADGRVTILAYALGEESFSDVNGNNVWDTGEPFQDLGDVVKDVLNDNSFDSSGGDQFVSLNGTVHGGSSACVDGSASNPLFALTENTPSEPGTCDATWSSKVYVRRAIETVLSTSTASPIWLGEGTNAFTSASSHFAKAGGVCGNAIALRTDPSTATQTMYPLALNSTWYLGASAPASGSVVLLASDSNPVRLNPMPAGTTIAAFIGASVVDGVGGATVANTAEAPAFSLPYSLATGASVTMTVKITSPGPKLQPLGTSRGGKTETDLSVTIVRADPPATCP